jgi:hypothetical protein
MRDPGHLGGGQRTAGGGMERLQSGVLAVRRFSSSIMISPLAI